MIGRSSLDRHIDLRGTPCPINYVRCCLALEELSPDEALHVDLDRGEPEAMVISGLREAGHSVEIISHQPTYLSLLVTCGAV